jgi:hypothetical protein
MEQNIEVLEQRTVRMSNSSWHVLQMFLYFPYNIAWRQYAYNKTVTSTQFN